jgi:hypothetical protein
VQAEDQISQPAVQAERIATATSEPKNPINLSQTVGEVTVTLKYAKKIDSGLEIGICYTTLDGGEWYSLPDSIQMEGAKVKPDEAGFGAEIKADATKTGERCEFIRYKIDEENKITTPIKFAIKSLNAVPREMYSACEEVQQRIDTNPAAQAAGIKMDCKVNDNGFAEATLTDHNPATSQQDAQAILDQIVNREIKGPWDFTITEIE